MNSLKFGMRDTTLKFNKRAVVPMAKVFEVVAKAKDEKIIAYMIIYAYNGELYSVGYEESNQLIYNYGKPNGETESFNTFDEMVNACNFEGNVTVLRELQSLQLGEVVEPSINDNYLLKEYLIDESYTNYNNNMSQNLIDMFDELRKEGKKDSKTVNFFLIVCAIVTIAIIVIVIILGNTQ